MIQSSARWSKYFWRCNDINDGDSKNFGNFFVWIEITTNFERQKVLQTHSQYLDSSNSDHSRTNFILITSYFIAHQFGTCVMNLLVPNLKRRKTCIPSFDWKSILALVRNNSGLHVMGGWSRMGALTLEQGLTFWRKGQKASTPQLNKWRKLRKWLGLLPQG